MRYNLVFEGGGAKGLVFVGAMQAFEARGHQVGRVLGTSAGAITATLLAAGYDAAELLQAISEKLPDGTPRFASFMDQPAAIDGAALMGSAEEAILGDLELPLLPKAVTEIIESYLLDWFNKSPLFRQAFSFITVGGLYAGDNFLKWLEEKLNTGRFQGKPRSFGGMTLAQFHAATGSDLTVVGTDTTGSTELILNHRTAPDCPVAWAVRMSMSIPFVWREVVWQAAWGPYRGQDISGHVVVDGGVISNFPLELLIKRQDTRVRELMGEPDGAFTIGLLIDETMTVPGAATAVAPRQSSDIALPKVEAQQLAPIKRIMHLVDTMTQAYDKRVMEQYEQGVCRLPAQGYGTTEFDMTEPRMAALIAAGQAHMETFMANLKL